MDSYKIQTLTIVYDVLDISLHWENGKTQSSFFAVSVGAINDCIHNWHSCGLAYQICDSVNACVIFDML